MPTITRREFLGLGARSALALGLAGIGLSGCRPRPLSSLVIQAPASPPSLAFLRMAQQGVPANLAHELRFQLWSTVDEMRGRITAGQAQFSGLPVNVAATLYNRGVQVQLLNVYIWGILYLVTSDPAVQSLAEIKGQPLLIPFRGDLPDILTQYLLQKQGLSLEKDFQVTYVSAAPEAAQLLAAGRAKHAVLSEPSATLAIAKAKESGVTLRRAMDYAQAWAAATGRAPRLPMAGVVALPAVLRNRALLDWFQRAERDALAWVAANPQEASQLGAQAIQAIPPAVMVASLPFIQMDFADAQSAREDIAFFLQEMHALSPDLVGGSLPPAEFYYGASS